MRTDVEFISGDATLRGWLFSSEAAFQRGPAVVMAHGFTATRHMAVDKYASALAAAGFTILLFDHRGFGASGGEPRQQFTPWQQARGYRDAISYLEQRGDTGKNGVVVWGDSSSGGVATVVAAIDERVSALVVVVENGKKRVIQSRRFDAAILH